jgi:hypothetical protein
LPHEPPANNIRRTTGACDDRPARVGQMRVRVRQRRPHKVRVRREATARMRLHDAATQAPRGVLICANEDARAARRHRAFGTRKEPSVRVRGPHSARGAARARAPTAGAARETRLSAAG